MNKEIIIDLEKIKKMEERLNAQHERMNIISDNLKKTQTLVCENNKMLKQIIEYFDIE